MGEDKRQFKKRTFNKAESAPRNAQYDKKGKGNFKKRDTKENDKQNEKTLKRAEGINSLKSAKRNAQFEVVKQQKPQQYKKKREETVDGKPGLNRRQKQKVSDLIIKLRVSNYQSLKEYVVKL